MNKRFFHPFLLPHPIANSKILRFMRPEIGDRKQLHTLVAVSLTPVCILCLLSMGVRHPSHGYCFQRRLRHITDPLDSTWTGPAASIFPLWSWVTTPTSHHPKVFLPSINSSQGLFRSLELKPSMRWLIPVIPALGGGAAMGRTTTDSRPG